MLHLMGVTTFKPSKYWQKHIYCIVQNRAHFWIMCSKPHANILIKKGHLEFAMCIYYYRLQLIFKPWFCFFGNWVFATCAHCKKSLSQIDSFFWTDMHKWSISQSPPTVLWIKQRKCYLLRLEYTFKVYHVKMFIIFVLNLMIVVHL